MSTTMQTASAVLPGECVDGSARIIHFDATERRREKMRRAAGTEAAAPGAEVKAAPAARPVPAKPAPAKPAAPAAAARPAAAPAATNGNGHHTQSNGNHANGAHANGNGAKAVAAPAAPKPVAAKPPVAVAAPVKPAAPAPAPAKAAAANSMSAADLEKFLVNFVVEQTGYPAEMVELDADLEADLGIDSIKKAQLFGELAEHFVVEVSAETLSLDDFPTLRHVVNFLKDKPSKGGSSSNGAVAPATNGAAVKAAPIATTAQVTSVAPVTKAAPAPVAKPAAPAAAPATSSGMSAAELETFLINFVVEQTGYPPEMIELDADLEADLGIDSIKKAQLFGELSGHFEVQVSAETLSLDDFPTLRHVVNFLKDAPAKGAASTNGAANGHAAPAPKPAAVAAPAAPAPVAKAAAPAPIAKAAAPAPAAAPAKSGMSGAALEQFMINFVVEQTGYPPEMVELDADLEADLGIDSIKKAQLFGELAEHFDVQVNETLSLDDFPTLRHVVKFLDGVPARSAGAPVAAAAPVAPAPKPVAAVTTAVAVAPAAATAVAVAPAAPAQADPALEAFLINFVVEQTGYPPEMVELDADLEADLGIDSIKKAQLFGELAEHFEVQPTTGGDLSLDDFPTLRHVLNFLAAVPRRS